MERGRVLARNDPAQYDDLAAWWWVASGPLAMLHWIAKARGSLIPINDRPGAILIDLGCGAGLLAPHLAGKNYRHVGLDLNLRALRQAAEHDVDAICSDVLQLPLTDGMADVVSAGEILEHVVDMPSAVAEACRVLRPGGLLVLDTIAATRLARFLAVTIAERIPGGAPRGIHDSALFVDRAELVRICADHDVSLALRGLRPSVIGTIAWLFGRRRAVPMYRTWSTSVLFQGFGRKESH